MSAKQRSRNGWQYADINLNGVRKRIALGTKDPKEGAKLIRRIKADIALGKFNTQSTLQKTATLPNFFQAFFEYISSYMQPATVRNTMLYAKVFMDFVGRHLDLRKINAEQLDRWKVHILSRYSPSTYNIMWRTLHAAFNVAKRWNYLEENPFGRITKVKVEEKRRYLTWPELQIIIGIHDRDIVDPTKRHLRAFNQKFRLLLEVLVLTGMRRQEALDLKMSQIDMYSGVIFVEKTKSKSYRTLPMHPRVKEIVRELGDNLFNGMDPSSVSHRFARLVVRAGLDGSFKLHSLRHTFATNLVSKGVDLAVIQNLLGHSDIRTTLIYGKTTVETMKKDILKLDWPG